MRTTKSIVLGLLVAMLAAYPAWAQERPLDLERLIRIVARWHHLDPDLLAAIAKVESNGDSFAISKAGAQGLMQLMPATARHYGVQHPFDPVDNVIGAARLIEDLRCWQASQPDFVVYLPELLAAYNAGEGSVTKYKGVPPYQETRDYVRKVLRAYLLGETHALPSQAESIARTEVRARALKPVDSDRQYLDQLAKIQRERALAARSPTERGPNQ